MTTRGDLNRYQEAVDEVVALAHADLDDVMRVVLDLPPGRARDELLAVLPELTDQYGELVAVAAAEWYEDVRADAVGAQFNARLSDTADHERVERSVRAAAGPLFAGAGVAAGALLAGALHRYVSSAGRSTIALNVRADPVPPRFASVPRGLETCSDCLIRAARGFVTYSGGVAAAITETHDSCDCQVVPDWRDGPVNFEGFDVDAMQEHLRQARKLAGSDDPADLAAALRSMGVTTDAHVH